MNLSQQIFPDTPQNKLDRARATLEALVLAEAIQALGTVPSGELYAHVMAHLSLERYDAALARLEAQKQIEIKAHLITWVGK